MTAITSTAGRVSATDTRPRPWGRIVCVAAAIGTFAPLALSEFAGDSGAEITASLVDRSTFLMLGAFSAVLVAAGLFLAAARLGRAVPGDAGTVVTTTGSAVALMYAA